MTGGVLAVWTALGQVMQLGLVTCLGQVIIVVTLGSCADWLKLSQSGVPVADVAASDIGRLSGIVVWYC